MENKTKYLQPKKVILFLFTFIRHYYEIEKNSMFERQQLAVFERFSMSHSTQAALVVKSGN